MVWRKRQLFAIRRYLGVSNNGFPYPLCDEFDPFAKTERGKGSRKDFLGVRNDSQEMQSD